MPIAPKISTAHPPIRPTRRNHSALSPFDRIMRRIFPELTMFDALSDLWKALQKFAPPGAMTLMRQAEDDIALQAIGWTAIKERLIRRLTRHGVRDEGEGSALATTEQPEQTPVQYGGDPFERLRRWVQYGLVAVMAEGVVMGGTLELLRRWSIQHDIPFWANLLGFGAYLAGKPIISRAISFPYQRMSTLAHTLKTVIDTQARDIQAGMVDEEGRKSFDTGRAYLGSTDVADIVYKLLNNSPPVVITKGLGALIPITGALLSERMTSADSLEQMTFIVMGVGLLAVLARIWVSLRWREQNNKLANSRPEVVTSVIGGDGDEAQMRVQKFFGEEMNLANLTIWINILNAIVDGVGWFTAAREGVLGVSFVRIADAIRSFLSSLSFRDSVSRLTEHLGMLTQSIEAAAVKVRRMTQRDYEQVQELFGDIRRRLDTFEALPPGGGFRIWLRKGPKGPAIPLNLGPIAEIIGPNGVGKSTLVRVLANFIRRKWLYAMAAWADNEGVHTTIDAPTLEEARRKVLYVTPEGVSGMINNRGTLRTLLREFEDAVEDNDVLADRRKHIVAQILKFLGQRFDKNQIKEILDAPLDVSGGKSGGMEVVARVIGSLIYAMLKGVPLVIFDDVINDRMDVDTRHILNEIIKMLSVVKGFPYLINVAPTPMLQELDRTVMRITGDFVRPDGTYDFKGGIATFIVKAGKRVGFVDVDKEVGRQGLRQAVIKYIRRLLKSVQNGVVVEPYDKNGPVGIVPEGILTDVSEQARWGDSRGFEAALKQFFPDGYLSIENRLLLRWTQFVRSLNLAREGERGEAIERLLRVIFLHTAIAAFMHQSSLLGSHYAVLFEGVRSYVVDNDPCLVGKVDVSAVQGKKESIMGVSVLNLLSYKNLFQMIKALFLLYPGQDAAEKRKKVLDLLEEIFTIVVEETGYFNATHVARFRELLGIGRLRADLLDDDTVQEWQEMARDLQIVNIDPMTGQPYATVWEEIVFGPSPHGDNVNGTVLLIHYLDPNSFRASTAV